MIGTIINIHNRNSGESKTDSGGEPVAVRLSLLLKGQGQAKEVLSQTVKSTRLAVKRIGQVLVTGRPDKNGCSPRKIDTECEFFIVSWDEPHAKAVLELPPPEAQLSLFGDIGEESLTCFLDGLAQISSRGLDPIRLPDGFDQEVLQSCLALSELLNTGFDSIVFRALGRTTTLDRQCRDNLCQYLIKPPRLERWTLIGRLEALSGRGKLTGMIWDESGNRWLCRFKNEHLPHLPAAWMSCVELTGEAILEPDRDRILEVESIAVPCSAAKNNLNEALPTEGPWSSDWDSHDLEEIFSSEECPDEILKNIIWD